MWQGRVSEDCDGGEWQVWSVQRAQGKTMPDYGTLVVGREQDCAGGCFDSLSGAQSPPLPSLLLLVRLQGRAVHVITG